MADGFSSGHSYHNLRRIRVFDVAAIEIVGLMVFHDTGNLADKLFVIARASQEVESHFHPACDTTCGDDASGIYHSGSADFASRRNLSEPLDGHLAEWRCFDAVGFLAIRGGQAIQQTHATVNP